VEFRSTPQFQNARFERSASFNGMKSRSWSNFVSTRFLADANFNEAVFDDVVNLRFARFSGRVDFRETKFCNETAANSKKLEPSLILTLCVFEEPEKVTFYRTYLGQALLHNCNVSQLLFSNVQWLERNGTGKAMVFDEVIDLEDNHATRSSLKSTNNYKQTTTLVVITGPQAIFTVATWK
jgi:tRNA nucleotidyltransferase/poly(A) polymerase